MPDKIFSQHIILAIILNYQEIILINIIIKSA